MKKSLLSSALALSLLLTPYSVAEQKPKAKVVDIKKDGLYDNNNALVDESEYSLEEVLESIELVVHEVYYSISYETIDGKVNYLFRNASVMGTGIVIEKKDGKAYILTNNHVTSEKKFSEDSVDIPSDAKWVRVQKTRDEIYIAQYGLFDDKVYAKEVVSNSTLDAALLEVDGTGFKKFPYKIGNSDDLRPGDFVWLAGNPLGLEDYAMPGHVSKIEYPWNYNWFMVASDVQPGFSGGAVIAIRDGEYELVGMVVATLIRQDEDVIDPLGGYGMVIKINPIMKMVDKYFKSLEKKSFEELQKDSIY